jgi:hypothetical protein
MLFRVFEVEVEAAAGGPHHGGYGMAVFLQFGLAFGPVHVKDQKIRNTPGDYSNARPRPGFEFFFRHLAS